MAGMDDVERSLDHVELAIRTGDSMRATQEIAALERLFSQTPPASDRLDDVRSRIQRLMALADAAAEGTAAAHRWLGDVIRLANTLETYTSDGRRSVDIVFGTRTERF